MTPEFSIRPLEGDDFEKWRPLWDAYNAFYGRSGVTALPEVVTRSTWARCLDPAEPVWALVAVKEGEIVGLAHYLFHLSTSAIEPSCYLQDLFTVPAYRGRGVAGALIGAVYAAAKAAGTGRVYWHTHESNRTAQKLYDKLAQRSGFIVYRKPL